MSSCYSLDGITLSPLELLQQMDLLCQSVMIGDTMKQLWNDNLKGKSKYSENLSLSQFVHLKSHMVSPGVELGATQGEADS
jgi:hypothetical protein